MENYALKPHFKTLKIDSFHAHFFLKKHRFYTTKQHSQ